MIANCLPPRLTERACYDRRVRAVTLPCADCGDPKGFTPKDCVSPERISGAPYGIDGTICRKCDVRHRNAKKRTEAIQWQLMIEHHDPLKSGRDALVPAADREDPDEAVPADYVERWRAVQAAKREKNARGLSPELTPYELDAVLPPHDCARTQERLSSRKVVLA